LHAQAEQERPDENGHADGAVFPDICARNPPPRPLAMNTRHAEVKPNSA
jgi:hypothetical protein